MLICSLRGKLDADFRKFQSENPNYSQIIKIQIIAEFRRIIKIWQIFKTFANFGAKVSRKFENLRNFLFDFLVDLKRRLGVVRRVAGEHLVDEDTEGPPIDALAVPLALNHLRREVRGSAHLHSIARTPRVR